MNRNGHWTAEQIPDASDLTVVITGANSGIGYEASKALAIRGAQVILGVRSLEKGRQAEAEIRLSAPNARLEVERLDLASLASVQTFAERIASRHAHLDVLINNAGLMAIPPRKTAEGFEMQFGVNHVGHFALTGLLLEALRAAPAARIVTVSSGLHERGRINFDDLMGEQRYERWAAYSQSKLANLLFAYELDRRLKASGARAISLGAHPGYAATNLSYAGPGLDGSKARVVVMRMANSVLAQSAAMGALPTLYAATAPGLAGGEYIGPDGLGGARGYPVISRSSEASHSNADASRLWQVSEQLSGVHYLDDVTEQQPQIS